MDERAFELSLECSAFHVISARTLVQRLRRWLEPSRPKQDAARVGFAPAHNVARPACVLSKSSARRYHPTPHATVSSTNLRHRGGRRPLYLLRGPDENGGRSSACPCDVDGPDQDPRRGGLYGG